MSICFYSQNYYKPSENNHPVYHVFFDKQEDFPVLYTNNYEECQYDQSFLDIFRRNVSFLPCQLNFYFLQRRNLYTFDSCILMLYNTSCYNLSNRGYIMCGIVGYIGSRQAMPVLLNGLSKLEYRGYDSSGIAVMDNSSAIHVSKAKGRLTNLEGMLKSAPLKGMMGIGHTRWATHGEPSDLNAHPHTDVKGNIAIVHNGIIENHHSLRKSLQKRGCVFVSQTDTEVIAHLLDVLYKGDMLVALQEATCYLEGSYAIAAICTQSPDALYCIRKDSPLVVGCGSGEQFIASDIPALLTHTRDVIFLEDKEIAILKNDGVTLYDAFLHKVTRDVFHVNWDVSSAEKGGFPHFMIKEIYEEPTSLQKTFNAHRSDDNFPITCKEAHALQKLTIVACGTAYHAAVIGRYVIEEMVRLPVEVDLASEFRYRHPILNKQELVLAISQSGETADTLAALREAKRIGIKAIALTNVLGSSLARTVGDKHVLYTYAGPEIAVASTKAYITQVEMMVIFSIKLAVMRGRLSNESGNALFAQLSEVPALCESLLENITTIQHFADKHFDHKHIFYIGRGLDYALALEASLKLKEVSYIFSEAYAAGELKHGTIALIEPGTLVVAIITQHHLMDKTLSNIREVKARGAEVLIVACKSMKMYVEKEADELWLLPDANNIFMPLLAIIPMQLLAYYMAVARGCDVDKPRNLAKSVTVE